MKTLAIYLKDYKKETILAPLFKMLEAFFELLIPLVMASIIDKGIKGDNPAHIIKMLSIMILLGIIGLSCSITAQYFSAKAAVGFSTKLRSSVFKHIQSLSFTAQDEVGNSTLITRLTSDINQIQSGLNLTLRLFLRSPAIVLGAVIMAFTIDVKSAVVFVIAVPLLSVVVFLILLISIPIYKKVQVALEQILTATKENLTGVRVLRAFNKEQKETQDFNQKNQNLTDIQLYAGRISALMNPLTYFIINIALIVLLYVGAVQIKTSVLTQGQVVALVNYMSQILIELIKLANLIITISKATACTSRVASVLNTDDFMETRNQSKRTNHEQPIISFQNVSFAYKNAGGKSLNNITFQVKKGETVGIIGGTGAGKSTLIQLIPRFYDCTDGEITLFGKNIKEMDLQELRSGIGIVPQKAVLFEGSIRENLLWGNTHATEEEIKEALMISQAEEIVKTKENGIESRVERGGRNFSGGQKQRLTIARAIIRKPEILILDDSSSALDYATDAKLRKSIREMKNPPTVFIVSQRTSSIFHADKIIVLDNGEISGIGTHEQLLKSCSIYKEIYETQYKTNAG